MKFIQNAGEIMPIIAKKSKFIASISPVETEEEVKEFVKKINEKHPKATHNAYAYRIKTSAGIIFNAEDDKEVSRCAGNSILYVLEKQDVINAIIVVTRYYGGIKLGKGGLVRNYSKAAATILKAISMSKE